MSESVSVPAEQREQVAREIEAHAAYCQRFTPSEMFMVGLGAATEVVRMGGCCPVDAVEQPSKDEATHPQFEAFKAERLKDPEVKAAGTTTSGAAAPFCRPKARRAADAHASPTTPPRPLSRSATKPKHQGDFSRLTTNATDCLRHPVTRHRVKAGRL